MLIAQAQALASLNNAFKALAPILPQLSGLSLDAKRALTDLAGGLDQFVSNTANWRANFYSKSEQDNATRKALADDLAKVGVALPASVWAWAIAPVFLMAALPVSVGGWGTREAAAVAALAPFGVAASAAVGVGVVYGVYGLAQGALGALAFGLPRSAGR